MMKGKAGEKPMSGRDKFGVLGCDAILARGSCAFLSSLEPPLTPVVPSEEPQPRPPEGDQDSGCHIAQISAALILCV